MLDKYNRRINYLRIGVTDRCNLRCRYCMPAEGIDFSERKELLSYEELIRLASIFRDLGVEKIRLTGGEPFVRKDIGQLIQQLCAIFPAVHITTNATLLQDHIDLLKTSGVKSLNISIDSLDRNLFQLITRRDTFELVQDNILRCITAGLQVKLNMVAMKGINLHEIPDFITFAKQHDIEVRFIEAMPFNDSDGNQQQFFPASELLELIRNNYSNNIQSVAAPGSSALKYLIDDSIKVGIIPAYSRSLCGSCNRLRLTPKGDMLTCLYATSGINLRDAMRKEQLSDQELKASIQAAVLRKKRNGFEEEALRTKDVFESMTTIGG